MSEDDRQRGSERPVIERNNSAPGAGQVAEQSMGAKAASEGQTGSKGEKAREKNDGQGAQEPRGERGTAQAQPEQSRGGLEREKVVTSTNAPDGSSDKDKASTSAQLTAFQDLREILTELASRRPEDTAASDRPQNIFNKLMDSFQHSKGSASLIGKYANLLPPLEDEKGIPYAETALIGAKALRVNQLDVAQAVYEEVSFHTTAAALNPVIKGVKYAALMLIAICIFAFDAFVLNKVIVDGEFKRSGIAFIFGCVGGIVSLLSRLSDFADNKPLKSREYLAAYGFCLPIIGGLFALVLAAVLDAGIITLFGNKVQMYVIAGFLAGFSERFTEQILDALKNLFNIRGSDGAKTPR